MILKICSVVALLYGLAYLFFGGYDDAPGYVPGLAAVTILALLTFYGFRADATPPNKRLERPGELERRAMRAETIARA